LKRLQRAGHIQHLGGKRVPKRILEGNITGEPKESWANAVEIDIRETMEVRICRQVRVEASFKGDKGLISGCRVEEAEEEDKSVID
jgi:hypothetical protein